MKLHPLLTKGANPHYVSNGKNQIFDLEKDLTVTQAIGFCKGNIFKYTNREKGQSEADVVKANKYNDYLTELEKIPKRLKDTIVRRAWKNLNIEWDYQA